MDNLEVRDGKVSFVTDRIPAWHRLGFVASGPMDKEEAIERARANYLLEKHKLINPFTEKEMDAWGVFRMDTHELMGTVGSTFEVAQPTYIFEVMDRILKMNGTGKRFATAGVLGKGERVFATAYIDEFDIMGSGDIHRNYLLGANAHNGTMSRTFMDVITRVVCANTLVKALSEKGGTTVKAKNTKNGASKIKKSLDMVERASATAMSVKEILEELAQRKVNGQIVADTIAKLFNVKVDEKTSAVAMNQIMTVKELFEINDRDAFPQFRGTGYNLLQSITEFTDHHKNVRGGEDEDTQRATSALFGTGRQFKERAFNLVMEAIKDAPLVNQPVEYSFSDTGLMAR